MAKTIAHLWGFLSSRSYLGMYRLWRSILGEEKAFNWLSETLARAPGMPGVYTRRSVYRRVLKRVGGDVYFGFMSLMSKPTAEVGERVYIGRFCVIGDAELCDEAILADGVQVLSGRHQHGRGSVDGGALRDNPQEYTRVRIGRGAWVGAGAVVMADVGDRAVVGAGAVVVKPVPEGAKVGGVPAKLLG